ncbi:MAG TPA: IS6 family transposase, partial [Nitrospiraceae bacterium]|nr:IS6 family transposase [Nitrospiraceae bacterium]
VPEFERRWSRYANPVHSSWRMDETAVPVRGGKHYLYRAVDKYGRSVDSLLCESRDRNAARAFFRHAVARPESAWPRKVNVDGYAATQLALRQLGREDSQWRCVAIRSHRYLNNIVEQDHRAIKRRCSGMLGMKSFNTAKITLAGIKLAHRIRKQQFSLGDSPDEQRGSLKQQWDRALARTHASPRPVVAADTAPTAVAPELKRSPAVPLLTETRIRQLKPLRYARKIADRRGLYLLVAPNGGRYWRYNYRFQPKAKTLSLGVYPDVSLEKARARHQTARFLLADGIDPSTNRTASMSTARGAPVD